MCYFLTIGIPESFTSNIKKAISPEIFTWQCENKSIMAHFDDHYRGYILTTGMCSCDLYHSDSSETQEEKIRKLRRKYKKKGWSEAKINRAVEEAIATRKAYSRGLRADVRDAIGHFVNACGDIYVFVHFYSGNQTTENVSVNLGPTVRVEDFRSGVFVLEPDVLIRVVEQKR